MYNYDLFSCTVCTSLGPQSVEQTIYHWALHFAPIFYNVNGHFENDFFIFGQLQRLSSEESNRGSCLEFDPPII